MIKILTTYEQYSAHLGDCSQCKTAGSNIDEICSTGKSLLDNFPDYDFCKLPELTCVDCHKTWAVEEYGQITEHDTLDCPHCGMRHEVEQADWELTVKLVETGTYITASIVDDLED